MQIDSHSPLTGQHIATYTTFTTPQVHEAIDRAYAAQPVLAKLSVEEMTKLFNNLHSVINKYRNEIAQTIHQEIGKPQSDAEFMEVQDILDGITSYLKRLSDFKKSQKLTFENDIFPDSKFGLLDQPIGTIGVIMPWNYPFWLPMIAIVPAVMMGNPIVFKPSSSAISTGLWIEKLFKEAGFPQNTVQTIIGGPLAGYEFVKSEKIGRIMFVGSTEVGLDIAKRRIQNKNNNLTIEMGGNSAAMLFDDANFENSVDAIFWNASYYAGQVCTRTKRILIHKTVFEQAKSRFIFLAKKYNNPTELVNKIGAVINKPALKLAEHRIKNAIEAGNSLLEGGMQIPESQLPEKYRKGNFFPITVMEIKNRNTDLLQKETFAPVLPLIPFSSIDEALEIANETKYGLSANIFSNDRKKIEYLIEKLDAGMIFVNDSEVAYPGGYYWKGLGASYLSTGSDERFESMFNKKVIWEKDPSIKRDYWFT